MVYMSWEPHGLMGFPFPQGKWPKRVAGESYIAHFPQKKFPIPKAAFLGKK